MSYEQQQNSHNTALPDASYAHDYSNVSGSARIATYDDLRSAPRITEIKPTDTQQYIENLASTTYKLAHEMGGNIPYTVIREVTENFIHAQFQEIIVSILDRGNTIRFADQGPGIADKEKAQLPGFTSAIEPMKHFIRGVGSGLPIVREYMDYSHGSLTIEDNLEKGAVVTISLTSNQPAHPSSLSYRNNEQSQTTIINESGRLGTYRAPSVLVPPLTTHGKTLLPILLSEGELGVTELSKLSGMAPSSTHATLKKLEESGLITRIGKKRALTDFGNEVARQL